MSFTKVVFHVTFSHPMMCSYGELHLSLMLATCFVFIREPLGFTFLSLWSCSPHCYLVPTHHQGCGRF